MTKPKPKPAPEPDIVCTTCGGDVIVFDYDVYGNAIPTHGPRVLIDDRKHEIEL